MIGELTAARIDHLLHTETVGRIACHAAGRTYIVPIAYHYDGDAIYAYSFEGMKLQMMRANPDVCFEIEHFERLANWESVVVQGRYEELEGPDAVAARSQLVSHFRERRLPWMRTPPSATEKGGVERVQRFSYSPEQLPIVYRIVPTEKTGRFERAET